MNPRHGIDIRLAQARDEVARNAVVLAERTKECREAKRRLFDARTRLERLLVEANRSDALAGVH
jgi:hypothetical protein